MTVQQLEDLVERRLSKTGAEVSKVLHAEAIHILKRVHKVWPIEHLMMGNGGWWFKGPEVDIVYTSDSDTPGENGKAKLQEVMDDWAETPNAISWAPRHGTSLLKFQIQKLNKILTILTDGRYLKVFDVTSKDLR